jgi:hypothetical protein
MLEQIWSNVRDHGIKYLVAGLFAAAAWYVGNRRAHAKWRRREFLDRLNVSMNLLIDGRLQIRTLLEKSCQDVFLNSAAVEAVVTASKRTTAADPILPLPKDDYWYFLNAVLNDVAEQFAEGTVKRDLGLPVNRGLYLMCLTFETAGELRTRKVRAMMVRKDVLLNLPEETPKFDSPHHVTRWQTLQQMRGAYETSPWRFIEVEICL